MNVVKVVLIVCVVVMLSANADAVLVVNKTTPCTSGDVYFPTITSALKNASDGDTIVVCSGTYLENIDINISVTLKSFSQNPMDTIIQANDTSEDVIEVHASYVTISGFTITGGSTKSNDDGIDVEPNPASLNPSDHANISNNVIYNTYDGIQLEDSGYAVIFDNTIHNTTVGIEFYANTNAVYNNTIYNNTIRDSDTGIQADFSTNVFYLNRFINNTYNAIDCGDNNWNSTEIRQYSYQGDVYSNYTGNYWDDYSGIDSNNDGIGDMPYQVSTLWCGEGESSNLPLDYYPMLFETEQPPVISNIRESDLTNTSITISWYTNVLSANRVLYSLNSDLSSPEWSEWDNNTQTLYMNDSVILSSGETMYPEQDWDNYTQNPSITLSGLSPNTTYYYSAFSYKADNTSLYSNSSIRNFTTLRDPKTWYVDDDLADCLADFTSIQDAVNVSMDGDTIIVCNGTYVENVFVNKTLNITGIGNPVVDANQKGSGFTLASNGNVVQGFYINNSAYPGPCPLGSIPEAGIKVGYTTYLVSGMSCIQITDHESTDNIIRNNTFNGSGIFLVKGYLHGSDRNLIAENTFIASQLRIEGSSYNNITLNTFAEGTYNSYITIEGLSYRNAGNNLIYDNTFVKNFTSSMPAVWIKSYAEGNTVSNNTFSGYGGIRFDSGGCVIQNNLIVGDTPVQDEDAGIKINHASDCLIYNNTVKFKYAGIKIDSSSPYTYSTNLTLRENRMLGNTYDFYFDPGEVYTTPQFRDFDFDIDTSNNVSGGAIYYIKNASNAIFDQSAQPPIGFFACINCKNVIVRNIGLFSNSHGIILYNTSDSTIDSTNAFTNYLTGLAIYYSSNVTITNSDFSDNGNSNYGSGLYLGGSENTTIENTKVEKNWCYGIKLDESSNNTILDSNITDNGPSFYLPPTTNPCQGGYGFHFSNSNSNTIQTNHILRLANPQQGIWIGGQRYGIYLSSSNSNLIYNNYFNNSINAYDNGNNFWNISKTPGTNIINGSYLGGNYWHDYTGADTAGGDGLGDTLLPYNSSGNIAGGDYLPLTNVTPDYTAPFIGVISPEEGKTYSANYVYLKVHSPDPDIDRWWYSLNSASNVTFTPNTTITGLSNGDYTLIVYVNDTAGNLNFTVVNFSINVISGTTGGGGTAGTGAGGIPVLEEVKEPQFSIEITPKSKSYTERSLTLAFTSQYPLRRASYIVDNSSPTAISLKPYATAGTVEIERLSLGEHRIMVNGEDYYAIKGNGEVKFKIIPLTLGELLKLNTTMTSFTDDVAFSFFGRKTDYTLTFEAKGGGKIDIYLNKFHRNGIQSYNNLSGNLVTTIQLNSNYQTYEIPILENITPDVENIISFVSENAWDRGTRQWEIKNVSLIPSLPFSFPQIKAFTLNKSISENETMTTYLKIDGIINGNGSKDYRAYIYLLTPDGKKLYYPDWSETKKPIDSYYLRTNYYGRLPSSIKFNNSFSAGTYILVGKIADGLADGLADGFNTVSLSTDKLYYNNQTSVKLYINREIFSDGQEVIIEHMLTGNSTQNGTLLLSMEDPESNVVHLPTLSEKAEGKRYKPIESDYFIAFEEFINSNWKEGTYILRSNLFNDDGVLVAEDIQTFEVCGISTIKGTYLRNATDNDTSPFVLSRIRLIDSYTLETNEFEFKGNHFGYSITASPSKYYLAGEAYTSDGKIYYIPMVKLALGCENRTRNLPLRYTGEIDLADIGVTSFSLNLQGTSVLNLSESEGNCILNADLFQGEEGCSKPKVYLFVELGDEAVEKLLQTYPGDTPETLKRYFSIKVKELIQAKSPGVIITSDVDVKNALLEQENFLAENPDEADLSRIRQMVNAEYILRFNYVMLGDTNLMNLVLLDVDNVVRVSGVTARGDDISILNDLINSQGDLKSIIETWEVNNPKPPRDPSLLLTLNPETLTFEEGKDKAVIKAVVRDCRGKAIEGAKVYFKEVTDRGYVKAEGKGDYGYVFSTTDALGVAKAEYFLMQSKGVRAGVDKIEVFAKARGGKRIHRLAMVKIAGIGIEIKPEKDELLPKQQTLLHIFLYKEELGGKRTPLADKMILIEKFALLDGKVFPLGIIDAYNNPITGENGRATIKFVAGKKEGLVKIPAVYQGLGYTEAPRDEAFIEVKEKEFVLFITWTRNSLYQESGTTSATSNCPHLCCPLGEECYNSADSGSSDAEWTMSAHSSIYFTSKTYWKESTGKERITASYAYKYQSSYSRTHSGSYTDGCSGNSGISGSSHVKVEDTSLSSRVSNERTWLLWETSNGDLVLAIDPIQWPVFLMKGTETDVSTSSFGEGTSTFVDVCIYDGDTGTNPRDGSGCSYPGYAEKQRVSVPYYEVKPGLLILKKTGKDRWQEVVGDYHHESSKDLSSTHSYSCSSRSNSKSVRQEISGHIEIKVVKR